MQPPGSHQPDDATALLPAFPPRALVVVRPGVLTDAVLERLADPTRCSAVGGCLRRVRTHGGHTWDVSVAHPATASTCARALGPQVALLIDVATAVGQAQPGDLVLASHIESWDEEGRGEFSWEADFSGFNKTGFDLGERLGGDAGVASTVWEAPLVCGAAVELLTAEGREAMLRASGMPTMALEPASSQVVETLRACRDVPTIVVRAVVDEADHEPKTATVPVLGALPMRLLAASERLWASHAATFLDAARDRLKDHAEEVVASLEQAAREFITREAFPGTWAMIQKVLGDVWRERAERGQTDDVDRAVTAYEAALGVLAPGSEPELWARAKAGLGQSLAARRGEERSRSIEDALVAFEEALKVQDRPELREDWARTQHAKGLALRRRLVGDRAANLEDAILAFRAARAVRAGQDENFSEWARAGINLATTYRERLLGAPEQNRRDALTVVWEIVPLAMGKGFAEEFAASSYTLGLALAEDTDEETRPSSLDAARIAYEQALTVWTRSAFPRDWALAQIALGNVHRDLAALDDREGNLEEARQAYERALEVYTREADPQRWAAAKLNLGNVYRDLSSGSRDDSLERAHGAYRDAGEVYGLDTDPAAARRVRTNLGRLLLGMGEREQAYTVLREAIEADRRSYAQTGSEAARRAEVAEAERLYSTMVECCMTLERVREAFMFADSSRSRLLREQLGTRELPPPESVPADLLEEEARLLARLGRSSDAGTSPTADQAAADWLDAARESSAARQALEVLWERMRSDYRAEDYVALRRGDAIEWRGLTAWLEAQSREAAILEFYCLEDSTVAFTVRKGDEQPRTEVILLGREDLSDCVSDLYYEIHRSSPDSLRTETWKRRAAALLAGAVEALTGVDLLYLIPHHQLHYLPLHAVENDGRALIERTALVYAPSAAVALRLAPTPVPGRGQSWSAGDGTALVVGDPERDRPFAAQEAELIASTLGASPMIGAAATKRKVASGLEQARIAHVASHAFFDDDDPLASGLVLAEGEPRGVLSARELIDRPLGAQLLVLSGCQTGLQDVRPGDELVGLARALFYAGVPSLVLSLWEVNDPATSKLMLAFYHELLSPPSGKEATLADALRGAMLAVRAECPHTYLWGAFALFGRWR